MHPTIKKLMSIITGLLLFTSVQAQFWTAADLGIVADGITDQTASLQTAFNDPDVQTVWFSNKTNSGTALFVINGTLTIPVGKVLKFEAGNRLIGHGIITGGIIDASMQSWIFGDSLTVNPRSTSQGWVSAKWFGAVGAGGVDDQPMLQKAANACIRNGLERLRIPQGNYTINQPLILRGINYNFFTLDVSGETTFWGGGTQITANFNNTFAIGIHLGKGCKIRNLAIQGQFTPPALTNAFSWFSMPFEDFTDGVCRDEQYSPYAGIVIDPFTNLPGDNVPPDGGYPGLTDQYGSALPGAATQTGSSGITIEDVTVTRFVVGVLSSPNGKTRNAEMTLISRTKIQSCKLAISAGQDQEKDNVIDNLTCWGGTHTVFGTNLYGIGKAENRAGNWYISNVNIAGAVVRFISNIQNGWFPTYITNVYAESLGSFGSMYSTNSISISNGSQITNSSFNFAAHSYSGLRPLINSGTGMTFKNCAFRYYDGQNAMMLFNSTSTFEDCKFSGVPVQIGQLSSPGSTAALYVNCTAGTWSFGFNQNRAITTSIGNYLYYNNLTMREQQAERSNDLVETYKLEGKDVFVNFMEQLNGSQYNVTISPTHTTSFTPANVDYYQAGHLVLFNNPSQPLGPNYAVPLGYGIITSISGGVVNVGSIWGTGSADLVSGTYGMSCLYPAGHLGTFMGNITGPNQIDKVARDYGWALASYPGFVIKAPYNNSTNGWVKILNYNNPTPGNANGGTFTTLGNYGTTFTVQDTALYFNNGATKTVETTSKASNTMANQSLLILYKGEIITEMAKSDKAVTYKVCQTGYKFPYHPLVPAGETRKAVLCPVEGSEFWKVTGNNISNGNNIFGTLSNDDVKIKTNNADVGIITKTGRFGIRTQTPNKDLEVNGEARITNLPGTGGMEKIVFASTNGDLKSLASTGNPFHYLSGLGVWLDLPIIGPGSVTASQGLTMESNNVMLGDYCNKGGGAFDKSREINMQNQNLYFNSSEEGKIYMGNTVHNDDECMHLVTRLEISSNGINKAVNDYTPDASTSGLRFTDLTSKHDPIENKTNGVLSLDEDGDVIWVKECCAKKGEQMQEILDRMTRMEGELKANRMEINQLKSKLDKKLKGNRILMAATALFSILFGGHGVPGFGK